MSVRTFSCTNCKEPFTVHLPEDTKKAARNKCGDKDTTNHNLQHTIQCENCEHRNTIYYCTDRHPILMTELRKFLKVLVAVDGSEYSMNAAEYATSIVKQFGSQLIALHVITSDISTSPSASFTPQMEEIKKNAHEYFEKIRRIGDKPNWDIPLRTELIVSSSVVGGIIDFAEKENVDLIVVGTRGKSGFRKLLLGSVASGIVNYAHCPVLIVK